MEKIIIDKEIILTTLQKYGIEEDLIDFSVLYNGQKINEDDVRIKIIHKVITANQKYIIKFIHEKEHTIDIMEQQSIFSETLRKCNVLTPAMCSHQNQYCMIQKLNDLELVTSIQEYIYGEELKFINYEIIYFLANLLLDTHLVSKENNLKIEMDTIWNMFNKKTDISIGYNVFKELINNYRFSNKQQEKINYIISLFEENKKALHEKYKLLDKYAVQGDFSTNNIIVDDTNNFKALIDFNVAGNDYLINDAVIQGIFICYVMDLEVGLNNTDRDVLFSMFINVILESNIYTTYEKSLVPLIKILALSMIWFRVDKFEEHLKIDNQERINSYLDETIEIIGTKYHT